MAVLSDRTIREQLRAGRIVLDPLDESCIQPASVDLHLDGLFRVFLNHTMAVIDVKQDLSKLTELVEVGDDGVFVLHPGEFVLGSTRERIGMPDDLVARVEGKSSLGRLGLLIHSTAGFVDPGFDGHITLELSNVANLPITLYPGMKIGQISFLEMTTPVTARRPSAVGAEVLPVAAGRRASLALVLGAHALRAVGPVGRAGELEDRDLPDPHPRVEGDRQVGDVRQLEGDVPGETRVQEPGR